MKIINQGIHKTAVQQLLPRHRKKSRWSRKLSFLILLLLLYTALMTWYVYRTYSAPVPEPVTLQPVESHESPVPVAPDYPDLRHQLYQELVTDAEVFKCDPKLARSKYDIAVAFAKEHGIDPKDAVSARNSLQRPTLVPESTKISLVNSYREGPVTWIEVTVQEPSSGFLSGLNRVDFDLFADEKRIHRMSVAESVKYGRPPDVAILLDHSGSTQGKPSIAMVQAAIEFIKQVAPTSRIKLWAFADRARPVSRWSNDPIELSSAVRALRADGGTALFDVIRDASDDTSLLDHPAAIVLFTDGTDTSKGPLPKGILNKAIANKIPFHVVALKTGEINEPLLKQLASDTAGSYSLVEQPEQLLSKFSSVAKQLSTPVYRLAVLDPIKSMQQLTLQVGTLTPIQIQVK